MSYLQVWGQFREKKWPVSQLFSDVDFCLTVNVQADGAFHCLHTTDAKILELHCCDVLN